jgi:PAS domain S-box-containing protein
MNFGYTESRSNAPEGMLRRGDEQSRLFIELVQDYAIFMLDREGYVISWNVGAERIKGYKAHEILGKHFSIFYQPEEVSSGKSGWALEVAARDGRFEDEGWRVRKDGSKFWANVIITAVKDAAGDLIGFGKVTRDCTQQMLTRRALEDSQRKLHESEKSLRELSLHLIRTQDQERQRIGRELHDSLGQYLSVLKMKLDSIDFSADGLPNQDEIAGCSELAENCLREVRTISYLLFPPFLEERGLSAAVAWYVEGFAKRSGIQTTCHIPSDFERPSRDVELVLFRVLQESLTNVHRHSGSATAEVRLLRTADAVTLEVEDRGRGLSPEVLHESLSEWLGARGVGLRGMNERVHQAGGTFEIDSSGSGMRVRVTVPNRVPLTFEESAKTNQNCSPGQMA